MASAAARNVLAKKARVDRIQAEAEERRKHEAEEKAEADALEKRQNAFYDVSTQIRAPRRSSTTDFIDDDTEDGRNAPQIPEYDYDSDDTMLGTDDTDARPVDYIMYQVEKMGAVEDIYVTKYKALGCLAVNNPIRRFCIRFVVTNKYFDYFIILAILANCVTLAMNDPPEEAEYVFTAIFTIELIGKVIGLGFVWHEHTYLRDSWNKLDFLIVVMGWISLIPGANNFTAIRAFRVFRALKAITAVPGLRIMVMSLGLCLIAMGDVVILIICAVILFSIFGLHLFAGVLRQKCIMEPGGGWESGEQYNTWVNNESHWLEDRQCGNNTWARACPPETVCINVGDWRTNPNFGYTNFDHFGWSSLAVFQLITMDFWEDVYDRVLMSVGPLYVFYFILIIFLGAFYLINLVLAVVATKYADVADEISKEAEDAPAAALASTLLAKLGLSSEITPTWLQWKTSKLVESTPFVIVVIVLILGNTIVMAIEHPGMSEDLAFSLFVLNCFFTGCFVIEMILKMTAYSITGYFFDLEIHKTRWDKPEEEKTEHDLEIDAIRDRNRSSASWNRFDSLVVFVSVIEIIVVLTVGDGVAGLAILRTFRLLRVLKLGQSWKTMNKLITTIGNSIGNLGYLTLVLCIIIYVFAVLGKELYRDAYLENGKDPPLEEMPRWSFVDFQHGFMMIFRILCGEWVEPLWDNLIVADYSAIVFYITVLIVGNFVILNLFLALLLSAFEQGDEDDDNEDAVPPPATAAAGTGAVAVAGAAAASGKDGSKKSTKSTTSDEKQPLVENEKASSNPNEQAPDNNQPAIKDEEKPSSGEKETPAGGEVKNAASSNKVAPEPTNPEEAGQAATKADGTMSATSDEADSEDEFILAKDEQRITALCCCSPATERSIMKLRAMIYRLVMDGRFEAFIFLMIAWSSIMLCFEDKDLREKPDLQRTLFVMNVIFAVVFTIEFLLKLTAFGWGGYFGDGWNLLDFSIVIVSIVALAVDGQGGSIRPLAALRTLRALRPLRAVRRWEGMRIVVNSLLTSIPSIANVLVVCMLFWLIFSILGVQLFGGRFYKCTDRSEDGGVILQASVSTCVYKPENASDWATNPLYNGYVFNTDNWVEPEYQVYSDCNNKTGEDAMPCDDDAVCLNVGVPDKWTCCADAAVYLPNGEYHEGSMCDTSEDKVGYFYWRNSKINFDNVAFGFIALFQVATFEGWMEVMQDSVDSVGFDRQPRREHQFHAYYFYVVFIVVGSFFILNLFIGVIIDNFNSLKRKYEEEGQVGMFSMYLTDAQKKYVRNAKAMLRNKPSAVIPPPNNSSAKWFYDLSLNPSFETFIIIVIIVNTVIFCLYHFDMNHEWKAALFWLNVIFTAIYVIEAFIKIVGLRVWYFKSSWNRFDFIIVVCSVLALILEALAQGDNIVIDPGIIRVFRVLRVIRLLRSIKYAQSLKSLLVALMMSAPALVNIGTLLFLVVFIYACVGMNLFKYVKHNGAINDFVNFEYFGRSMLVLFRLSTSAGWNDITDACSISPPDCDPNWEGIDNGNCGDRDSAWIYFSTFVMISFLIIVNMYIAVILDNLIDATDNPEETGYVSADSFDDFYLTWQRYDPHASQFIDFRDLRDFLEELPSPMGFPDGCSDHNVADLAIPLYIDAVPRKNKKTPTPKAHCVDVLDALVQKQSGASQVESEKEKRRAQDLQAKMDEKLRSKFPKRVVYGKPASNTKAFHNATLAAKRIQRAWRQLVNPKPMETVVYLADINNQGKWPTGDDGFPPLATSTT